MPRATNNPATRRRKNKVFKAAKGYIGRRGTLIRAATETVEKAWARSFGDRRKKKGLYRNIWVVRINAAAREHGLSYSRFICGLKQQGIALDRRQLAELAVSDPQGFQQLTKMVKAA